MKTALQIAKDRTTKNRKAKEHALKPVSYTHLTLPTMAVV